MCSNKNKNTFFTAFKTKTLLFFWKKRCFFSAFKDNNFAGPLPKARMSSPSPFPEMEENREVKAVAKL